jgi:hypothetical protein
MPSRGEEIFWCLKQLFSSQFCPKTANLNLSETKSLVFAIKNGILSLFVIIFLGNQQKRIEKSFPMVMFKNMCDIDLYSQISM